MYLTKTGMGSRQPSGAVKEAVRKVGSLKNISNLIFSIYVGL